MSNLIQICDALLAEQSNVATLNFSFTALATVALLETASLVTRWQQVAPTKKSVVGGGGLRGGGGDSFASALPLLVLALSLRVAKQSVIQALTPFI